MVKPTMRWLGFTCLCALALLGPLAPAVAQDKPQAIVYVAPIEGIIDLGLAPFVQRVLDEATQAGAAAVVLEVNTFGGRVDAAVQIRDALLNARIRTVAFVNKRAISAGALISSRRRDASSCPTAAPSAPQRRCRWGAPGAEAQPVGGEDRSPTCGRSSAPPPRAGSDRR